ncbi:MAG: hypothetical protein JXM71_08640, partial [Spirochaetales bacterium]|nr:hypothetical protein [Spirochaetales bacterium]
RDDQDEPLLVGRLLSALDAIVTTPEERASLEERIQARLILDESQLRVTPVEPEHNLARAMDYPGKLRLLERALKDGTTVEVAHTENGGSQTILAGVPREIRRMSSGTVVSLSTDTEGQKTIAISAIDTLRTLRSPTNGV